MQVLTSTQNVALECKPKDGKGNPAPVQNPTWDSSDPNVLTVTADPTDPLKAVASAAQSTGTALVTFRADADMGEGEVPIIGTLDVIVNPGMAVMVEIEAGEVTEQNT